MESIYKLEKVLILRTGNRLRFFFMFKSPHIGGGKRNVKVTEEILI